MGTLNDRGQISRKCFTSNRRRTFAHRIPPNPVRSRNYYFIAFWSCVFLIGVGFVICQTTLVLLQHFSNNVQVRYEHGFVQRPFPAVTICNLNPYQKSALYKEEKVLRLMNIYKYTIKKISCNSTPARCKFVKNSTIEKYAELYRFNGISDIAVLQSRVKRILTLEIANINVSDSVMDFKDFIKGCSFNSHDCLPSDWTSFIDPILGRCFTFNNDSKYLAKWANPDYSLRVVLKTNVSEFIDTSEAEGMKVYIHDQNEFPFPDIFGYNVQTKTATSFSVSYEYISRFRSTNEKCSNQKPEGWLYPLNYTFEGCQRTKFQQQIVKNCGCYDPIFPPPINSANVKACSVEDNCKPFWLQYTDNKINVIDDCWFKELHTTLTDNTCIQSCKEKIYKVYASSATWSSGSNIEECNENENKASLENYQKHGAFIEVYFKKLNLF